MNHLEPRDALQFLKQNPDAVFIDCRSEMEYFFVGHPLGAIHVAWNDGPNWEINPDFVAHSACAFNTVRSKESGG